MSPIFANHGFEPRMSFSGATSVSRNAAERAQIVTANELGNHFEELFANTRANLTLAQTRQAAQANRRRMPIPFKVGDSVWLKRQHIATDRWM